MIGNGEEPHAAFLNQWTPIHSCNMSLFRKVLIAAISLALVTVSFTGLASATPTAEEATTPASNTDGGLLMFQPTTIKEARALRDTAFSQVSLKREAYISEEENVGFYTSEVLAAWGDLESSQAAVAELTRVVDSHQEKMDSLVRGIYMSGTTLGIGGGLGLDILLMDGVDKDRNIGSALEAQEFATAGAELIARDVDLARAQLLAAELQYEDAVIRHSEASGLLFAAVRDRNIALEELGYAEQYAIQTSEQFHQFIRQYRPEGVDSELLPIGECNNWLVKVLYNAGFRGEDLREAWAIAMRESGGRDDAISYTNDYGIFQFNKATWQNADWWDDEALLDRHYNVAIAFQMSDGGRTWYPWGLDGKGRPNPVVYERSGWSMERIISHIIEPYERWYSQFPCTVDSVTQ